MRRKKNKEVNLMSFLLNGDKMRKRLAQILSETDEQTQDSKKNEKNAQNSGVSQAGSVE